jgi:hypothetical protein
VSRQWTEIDRSLAQLSDDYAEGASALSAHPVLREGLVKAAMNEAIWALYRAFPDARYELAEHLDCMGDVVRDQAHEDDEQERTEAAERAVAAAVAAVAARAAKPELEHRSDELPL